ncbi:MAG: hypothetical protein ACI4GY_00230 [Acutalibacteraceae bacterium]
MKKALSVLLALIMILSSLAVGFGVFAADGYKCEKCGNDCTHEMGTCHCCAECEYIDETYLTSCVKDANGHFQPTYCCSKCTGIWPCSCGCSCCNNYEDVTDDNNGPILNPDQQEQVIKGFQAILKKISDVFDMLFDKLFEFLRIGEIFPDLVK